MGGFDLYGNYYPNEIDAIEAEQSQIDEINRNNEQAPSSEHLYEIYCRDQHIDYLQQQLKEKEEELNQLKSTMLKVKLKPERENFKQPIKGTEESACYDCYCAHIEEKEDGLVICYLGFSQEIPKGWKAIIDPRSSIRNTGWGMANSRGTCDSDYRRELQASFRPLPVIVSKEGSFANIQLNKFPYKVGDRVCQISWERVNEVEFEITDTLSESNRKGGHGHTGLK